MHLGQHGSNGSGEFTRRASTPMDEWGDKETNRPHKKRGLSADKADCHPLFRA
jgi:hypothetical protein